ncbi:PREDICTED: major royal jelly protein 1-like [Trachymyrmex cornetzi]|uniref:major royal jelly protein 1-like n=1 Tax=Trachymyrmex cornetzi TaxID=471704 RepID=UPI00084F2B54|nr:PREDICTED: major royal jelly protein 1-like [Trachymyrmex cornetzi]XP_018363992.1 PREDICTED: major royal jelly protein 1-like [Trachymyrmex cornetzi]
MGHLFTLLILSMAIVSFGIKVNFVHNWRYCEYEWESQQQKEDAINSDTYNPYKCLFVEALKAEDGRIFITNTRVFGPGSPATLSIVTNKTGPGGPLLRPYPDWSWHNSNCTCDGIINVYYIYIRCNHIFVLDDGEIGETNKQICNPKLLIFDLKNDMLVKTIYIPLDIATNKTGSGLLVDVLVYVPNEKCTHFLDKMIIFMADTKGNGIVVYDSSRKHMCRVESDYMKPTDTTFHVEGENFTYAGGIFSMTIMYDELYYAPVSRKEIYKIKIKTLMECPNKEEANKQTKLVKKLSNQVVGLSSTCHYIFYTDTRTNSILGTNTYTKSPNNTVVLAQDDEKLQIISQTDISTYWGRLTGLSNRFQKYFQQTYNLSDINFRYFEMDLHEIFKKMD